MCRFAAIGCRRDVVAADIAVPASRREKTGDHLHRRRLAGAVRAEKAQHFASRHGKGNVVDGDQRAERFDQVVGSPAYQRPSEGGLCLPLSAGRAPGKKSGSDGKRFRYSSDGAHDVLADDDPSTAAFFRSGDARLCDDASPQSCGRPDLAQGDGRRAVVHFPLWSNRPAQALLYGSFLVHYGLALMGAVAAAQLAAAAVRAQPDRSRLCDADPPRAPRRRHANLRRLSSTPTSAITLICCGSISSTHRARLLADAALVVAWRHAMMACISGYGSALVFAQSSRWLSSSRCWSRCCPCSA